MITGVYVRFVFDSPYLNYWINHYLHLNFDYIIILFFEYGYEDKQQITSVDIKQNLVKNNILSSTLNKDNVIFKVINSKIGPNELYFKYKHIIPKNIDYLLQCDSDEYLLINDKYTSIQNLLEIKCNNIKCKNKKVNLNNIVTLGLAWTWHVAPFKYENINNYIYEGKKGGTFKQNVFYKYIVKINNLKLKEKCKHPIHGHCNYIFDIKDAQLLHVRQRGFNNILLKFIHYNKNLKGVGISNCSSAKSKSGNFTEMFNFIINFNLSNKKDIINKLKKLHCFGYDMKLKNDISEYINKYMINCLKNNNFEVSNKSIEKKHYDDWFINRLKTNDYSDETINLFIKNIDKINKILHQ